MASFPKPTSRFASYAVQAVSRLQPLPLIRGVIRSESRGLLLALRGFVKP